MAAARALARGDWEKAYTLITALKMWALMPQREAVQEMLKDKLKQEGLRIYLFTYGPQYRAVSQAQLCDMFQLDDKKARPRVRRRFVFPRLLNLPSACEPCREWQRRSTRRAAADRRVSDACRSRASCRP